MDQGLYSSSTQGQQLTSPSTREKRGDKNPQRDQPTERQKPSTGHQNRETQNSEEKIAQGPNKEEQTTRLVATERSFAPSQRRSKILFKLPYNAI